MIARLRFFLTLNKDIGGYFCLIKKAIKILRVDGFAGALVKCRYIIAQSKYPYHSAGQDGTFKEWIKKYNKLTSADINQMQKVAEQFHHKPLISVIMPTYNSNPIFLKEAIESVRNQIYQNWELCIADDASTNSNTLQLLKQYQDLDARIKLVFRKENGHISEASNSALKLATGDYIALLDHDDLLSADALFWVTDSINRNPDAGIIYSDEDKIDANSEEKDPYFKCDWNRELFIGHNMISHLGVYRTSLVKAVNGFRKGYEGSQDYDLACRIVLLIKPGQIVHIPHLLYHWRMVKGSTSIGVKEKPYARIAGQKVLNEFLSAINIKGKVERMPVGIYQLHPAPPDNPPQVTIIIPTKNKVKYLKKCISGILKLTTYPNYDLLIVDNGSNDPETLRYLDKISSTHKQITVLKDGRPFNFSSLINHAVNFAKGDFVTLLNNDTEVITPEWLTEMVSLAMLEKIGAVGAKLWYKNKTLQHGGIILGLGADGVAGHMHHRLPKGNHGYFGRASITQELSAVSAACMVVNKKIFLEVGGFDETNLAIAFNDVDFCLKLRQAGYRNLWTPNAELYHYESISRGNDKNDEHTKRFAQEVEFMKKKWGELLKNDPAYNPNLTLEREDFSLAWPPRISKEF